MGFKHAQKCKMSFNNNPVSNCLQGNYEKQPRDGRTPQIAFQNMGKQCFAELPQESNNAKVTTPTKFSESPSVSRKLSNLCLRARRDLLRLRATSGPLSSRVVPAQESIKNAQLTDAHTPTEKLPLA